MYKGRLFVLGSIKELYDFEVFKSDSKNITLTLFEEFFLMRYVNFNTNVLGNEWSIREREQIVIIFKYIKYKHSQTFKYFNTYDVIRRFEMFLSKHTRLQKIDIDYPDTYV